MAIGSSSNSKRGKSEVGINRVCASCLALHHATFAELQVRRSTTSMYHDLMIFTAALAHTCSLKQMITAVMSASPATLTSAKGLRPRPVHISTSCNDIVASVTRHFELMSLTGNPSGQPTY